MPSTTQYGYVIGRFLLAVGDTSADPDALPDPVVPSGKVRLTPLAPVQLFTNSSPAVTVMPQVIDLTLDGDGDITDPAGNQGIWLIIGQYEVSFNFIGVTYEPFIIEVTTAHTAMTPLDLTVAAPLVVSPATVFVVNQQIYDDVAAASADIKANLIHMVVSGAVDASGNLILTQKDGTTIAAGNVRGPTGVSSVTASTVATGQPATASINTTTGALSLGLPVGATGATYIWRGAWSGSLVAYAVRDVFSYNGSTYLVTTAHTSAAGTLPTANANVALWAAKGDTGPQSITTASATALASNASPTATLTGTNLALGIPQGIQGIPGPVGVTSIAVNTLAAGSSATGTINTGTGLLTLGLPVGATGATGVTSATATALAAGANPTASVNAGVLALGIPAGPTGVTAATATTLAAGASATVSLTGTTLAFGIPQGPAGSTVSPAFTGTPTAPTPTAGDNSTTLATTAFVGTAVSSLAPKASPALTGTPTAPTATAGTNTTQLATTAFAVAGDATRMYFRGAWAASTAYAVNDTLTNGGLFYIVTTAFTSGTTFAATNLTQIAQIDMSTFAPLASPALTGTPTAPTAAVTVKTTQLATTAFVNNYNNAYGGVRFATFSNFAAAIKAGSLLPNTIVSIATHAEYNISHIGSLWRVSQGGGSAQPVTGVPVEMTDYASGAALITQMTTSTSPYFPYLTLDAGASTMCFTRGRVKITYRYDAIGDSVTAGPQWRLDPGNNTYASMKYFGSTDVGLNSNDWTNMVYDTVDFDGLGIASSMSPASPQAGVTIKDEGRYQISWNWSPTNAYYDSSLGMRYIMAVTNITRGTDNWQYMGAALYNDTPLWQTTSDWFYRNDVIATRIYRSDSNSQWRRRGDSGFVPQRPRWNVQYLGWQ